MPILAHPANSVCPTSFCLLESKIYVIDLERKIRLIRGRANNMFIRENAPKKLYRVNRGLQPILGDPGADKGGEGKSKRVEKYIWNEEK